MYLYVSYEYEYIYLPNDYMFGRFAVSVGEIFFKDIWIQECYVITVLLSVK